MFVRATLSGLPDSVWIRFSLFVFTSTTVTLSCQTQSLFQNCKVQWQVLVKASNHSQTYRQVPYASGSLLLRTRYDQRFLSCLFTSAHPTAFFELPLGEGFRNFRQWSEAEKALFSESDSTALRGPHSSGGHGSSLRSGSQLCRSHNPTLPSIPLPLGW